ncbi:MAG TPA: alpha/beta hydrolase [Terriglobia bacterium]|nr:alpha/beta hydrolase [Terriglobia bacterium]
MSVTRHRHVAMIIVRLMGVLFITLPATMAQRNQPNPATQANICILDSDGTAHITRIVPVPETISLEAQKFISRPAPSGPEPSLAERRTRTDSFRKGRAEEARKLYPVNIEGKTIGGVRCDVITPLTKSPEKQNRVLINVHGGGFVSDSGSLVEGIPIANLTGTPVVSVYYRLAPEYPFPAAVDDTVAVYKELLKNSKPQDMGLFGTSAGAVLTAEVAVRLRRDGLPEPAALGIFSGTGDLSQPGDSEALYTIWGFGGWLEPQSKKAKHDAYVGLSNPKDPLLSPLYADQRGFPPTLFITSTRDLLLSGTTLLHRAFLRTGVDTQLVVFEALPHAFWYDYHLPETKEALEMMAKFFDQKLGR